MKIERELDKEVYVVARNYNKLLITTNKNIDIYSTANLITIEGKILEKNVLIGSIIKFGYWEEINMTYSQFIKQFNIERKMNDITMGYAVGIFARCDFYNDNELYKQKYDSNFKRLFYMVEQIKNSKSLDCINIDNEFIGNSDNESYLTNLIFLFLSLKILSKKETQIFDCINKIFDENKRILYYSFVVLISELQITKNIDDSLVKLVEWLKKQKINEVIKNELINNLEVLGKNINFTNDENEFKELYDFIICMRRNTNYNDMLLFSKEINNNITCLVGIVAGMLYGEETILEDWKIELVEEEMLKTQVKQIF